MEQNIPTKGNFTHRQRTLIISVGEIGAAILRAFQMRVRQRWGDVPSVACVAVVGAGPATEADDDLVVVPLPLDSGSATNEQAQEVLRARTSEVTPALLSKLADLSRLPRPFSRSAPDMAGDDEVSSSRSHRPPYSRHLRMASGYPSEIAVYLVAGLDDPIGGGILIDLASEASKLVSQHLNTGAVTTGLLLLPDGLAQADPEPALARARDTLRGIDASMDINRWGRSPFEANCVATLRNWPQDRPDRALLARSVGAAARSNDRPEHFTGGCYLLGPLNAAGWRLDRPEERIEFAAEALVQLILSPLRDLCENLCSVWPASQHGHNYGSIGLASWVFPREAAAGAVAHRLATEMIEAWLADAAAGAGAEAAQGVVEAVAFLAEHDLDPGASFEALLPAALLEETDVTRLAEPLVSLSTIRNLRQTMEDDAANRLEGLAERRSEMDEAADAWGRRLAELVQANLTVRLDQSEPGRLSAGEVFLAGIEAYLDAQRAELEEVADIHWKALERIDAELDRAGGAIEGLGSRFPEFRIRTLLRMVISPHRLVRLALTYWNLTRAVATYRSLWTHKMHTVLQILRRDLVVRAYEGALEAIREQQAQLAELRQALCQAQGLVGDTDTGLFDPQGFGLEHSILTPTVLTQLYEGMAPPPGELLAEFSEQGGPLSRWLSDPPEGMIVRDTCLAYARRHCVPIESLSIARLLLDFADPHHWGRSPDDTAPGTVRDRPVQRHILEALEALSNAAVPFLVWDATRLTEEEQEGVQVTAVLGTAEGKTSPLLEGAGDLPWPFVMTTGDDTRITAISVVRGLPLRAVARLEVEDHE